MSNALKCDICGQFYDIKSHVDNAFVFFRTDSLGKKLYMESAIKDCCPDCITAIKELLESRKEDKNY